MDVTKLAEVIPELSPFNADTLLLTRFCSVIPELTPACVLTKVLATLPPVIVALLLPIESCTPVVLLSNFHQLKGCADKLLKSDNGLPLL